MSVKPQLTEHQIRELRSFSFALQNDLQISEGITLPAWTRIAPVSLGNDFPRSVKVDSSIKGATCYIAVLSGEYAGVVMSAFTGELCVALGHVAA